MNQMDHDEKHAKIRPAASFISDLWARDPLALPLAVRLSGTLEIAENTPETCYLIKTQTCTGKKITIFLKNLHRH